ncbi:MAG: IS1634 family transposase [Bacteroidales bacterium]|nr:IS1634 family transposase [Bacteroidales bacterium]
MATVVDLSENFGIELSLSSVNRMMDQIDEKTIFNIQQQAYLTACGIFKQKINVLFYDCTTLYFESFTEDELKENGYSKDMKFNQPQVLLALLVTEHGLPIGYDVFPGSQYEGHTLEKAVKKIEKDYQINDIVFVADSAMLSEENMKLLESMGKRYIVGARLKTMSKKNKSSYCHLLYGSHMHTILVLQNKNGIYPAISIANSPEAVVSKDNHSQT